MKVAVTIVTEEEGYGVGEEEDRKQRTESRG